MSWWKYQFSYDDWSKASWAQPVFRWVKLYGVWRVLLWNNLVIKPTLLLGEPGNSAFEADPRIPPNQKNIKCKYGYGNISLVIGTNILPKKNSRKNGNVRWIYISSWIRALTLKCFSNTCHRNDSSSSQIWINKSKCFGKKRLVLIYKKNTCLHRFLNLISWSEVQ